MPQTNQQTPAVPASNNYRLDGIYPQRQNGYFMQRVKLAAGIISSDQARAVATTSAGFGQGAIHLTTRGSIEIHWLKESDLAHVKRSLTAVGLTSRGACGGAVRGIACSTQAAAEFPAVEALARRIHRHFTGNPRFERLPKKFKVAVEVDLLGKRHLIQDVGIVLSHQEDGVAYYDFYVAGGLGREPQPAFLFESNVSENRVIPLLEAIATVYAAGAPAGKRLKHLLRQIGESGFRGLVALQPGATEELPAVMGIPENFLKPAAGERIVVKIAAGELTSEQLITLAGFADRYAEGYLTVTADQDIAFHLQESVSSDAAVGELAAAGFSVDGVNFRVCPGSASCLAGLSATREIAAQLVGCMNEDVKKLTWAISGCPNSCTQPQLADVGIVSSSLVKGDDGERTPRFDLYRAGNDQFAELVEKALTLEGLCSKVREIV